MSNTEKNHQYSMRIPVSITSVFLVHQHELPNRLCHTSHCVHTSHCLVRTKLTIVLHRQGNEAKDKEKDQLLQVFLGGQ